MTNARRVKNVPVGDLDAYPNNPREHSDKQVAMIAESIKRFGFNVPIVVDSDMVVIAGHGRLLAAYALEMPKVPVIVCDDLTEDEIRQYRVVDNRVTEMGRWDKELLAIELNELDAADVKAFDFERFIQDKEPVVVDDDDNEFLLVVMCEGEEHQQQLYEEFQERGLTLKIME